MASIHKDPRGKSPYWYGSFYLPDGRRAFRSTKQTKQSEAMSVCLSWEKAAKAGRAKTLTEAQVRRVLTDILENATGETVQFYTCRSWLTEWIQNRAGSASPTTMQRYEQVVRDFLIHLKERADLTLAAISASDIRGFRDALREGGRTESTVNNVIKKVLNVPFAAAVKLGLIPVNPVAAVDSYSVKGGSKRQPLTWEQLEVLVRTTRGTNWEGLILAGLYTGLRLADLKKLTWDKLDLEARTLAVRTGKTDTPVLVPLHEGLFSWLSKQDSAIGKAPVFPDLVNSRIEGAGGLSAQFRKMLNSANVIGKVKAKSGSAGRQQYSLSFHSLRHSFVSALVEQGIASDIRKKLVGHASDHVHEIYSHHQVSSLRSAVESLPALAS